MEDVEEGGVEGALVRKHEQVGGLDDACREGREGGREGGEVRCVGGERREGGREGGRGVPMTTMMQSQVDQELMTVGKSYRGV